MRRRKKEKKKTAIKGAIKIQHKLKFLTLTKMSLGLTCLYFVSSPNSQNMRLFVSTDYNIYFENTKQPPSSERTTVL